MMKGRVGEAVKKVKRKKQCLGIMYDATRTPKVNYLAAVSYP